MVVCSLGPEDKEKTKALAQKLDLPWSEVPGEEYYLCFEGERLVVKDTRQNTHFSIYVDFNKEWDLLRRQKISYKKDLLCRAVGYKGQENYQVFDGTMGLAKDSLHLLHFGCSVMACDRDPVAVALVRDAYQFVDATKYDFQIFCEETLNIINSYSEKIDCLYLDPMFENIKKKSAPKKSMALLRERNIHSKSAAEVIHGAIQKGIKRIVVKRPLKGEQLYSEPSTSLVGKLVRYDVYTR